MPKYSISSSVCVFLLKRYPICNYMFTRQLIVDCTMCGHIIIICHYKIEKVKKSNTTPNYKVD